MEPYKSYKELGELIVWGHNTKNIHVCIFPSEKSDDEIKQKEYN